jgi:hypothetical protein
MRRYISPCTEVQSINVFDLLSGSAGPSMGGGAEQTTARVAKRTEPF